MRFSTTAIHAGQGPDPATGAIMTPVYLTSTYVQEAPGKHKGYDYARTNHPTRASLERNLAALEGGRFGLCFASGLAAENTVLNLLRSGDHVVSCRDLYGGTYRLFTKVWEKLGIEFTFVNAFNLDEIEPAIRRNTRLLWLESPSNPLLSVTDLAAAAKIAHAHGVRVVVDNTFATPYLQQPLSLGADLVVHSTTKYLGGHSDVVGGAIVTNDEGAWKELKFYQNAVGAVPGPLDCFLVLRGTKTLAVRMRQHCENARAIAKFLRGHAEVKQVRYPGLPDDPGHEVAAGQMRDFGGMISVELHGGIDRNIRFTTKTRVFSLAESLGGVESLLGHPVTMTHASIPKAEREKGGLPDALVRLSVGIEDVEDLIEDLDRAISESRGGARVAVAAKKAAKARK
ncbi:MAG: cystathionine gamma-synthase [Planctomycetes bacterium]|nr:cystathionine gamma-synthase [Planctomycetota bacterium]